MPTGAVWELRLTTGEVWMIWRTFPRFLANLESSQGNPQSLVHSERSILNPLHRHRICLNPIQIHYDPANWDSPIQIGKSRFAHIYIYMDSRYAFCGLHTSSVIPANRAGARCLPGPLSSPPSGAARQSSAEQSGAQRSRAKQNRAHAPERSMAPSCAPGPHTMS